MRLSTMKQTLLLWTLLFNGLWLVAAADDGHRHLSRRYGGSSKPKPRSKPENYEPEHKSRPLQVYVRPRQEQQQQQRPRYLDIGFNAAEHLDTESLFPDPALFNTHSASSQPSSSHVQSSHGPEEQLSSSTVHQHHLMQSMATDLHHNQQQYDDKNFYKTKKDYRRPSWLPQYVVGTAAAGTANIPEIPIVPGSSPCCADGNWRPLPLATTTDQSTSTSTSTSISNESKMRHESTFLDVPVSLYLPVENPDVVVVDDEYVVPNVEHSEPFLVQVESGPAPSAPDNSSTISLSPSSESNGTDVSNDVSGAPSSSSEATVAPTEQQANDEQVPVTASPTQAEPVAPAPTTRRPMSSPITTARPAAVATTKVPTTKAPTTKPAAAEPASTTTQRPRPPSRPAESPSQPQSPVSNDNPSGIQADAPPPVQQPAPVGMDPPPSQSLPSAVDSIFPNVPQEEAAVVEEPFASGIPGDLPSFADGGAAAAPAEEAPAAAAEESALPGIFSEFLNQVADMIEEFGPTTELPVSDEGLADGVGGGPPQADPGFNGFEGGGPGGFSGFEGGGPGGTSFGDEMAPAGSDVDTLGGGGDDAGGVAQESSDFGNFQDGSPSMDSPVDGMGETQSGSTNTFGQSAAQAASPATGEATSGTSSSGVSGPAQSAPVVQQAQQPQSPNYADDYLPPVASEPQIHPPMTAAGDYVDTAGGYYYGSVPFGEMSASLGTSGSYVQQRPSSTPEMMAMSNGDYYQQEKPSSYSYGGSEQYGYEGGGVRGDAAAQPGDVHGPNGIDEPQAVAWETPYHHQTGVDAVHPQSATYEHGESEIVAVNETDDYYGTKDNETSSPSMDDSDQSYAPVANHLEVHVSQSSYERPSPVSTTTTTTTTTTYSPPVVTATASTSNVLGDYNNNGPQMSDATSSASPPIGRARPPDDYGVQKQAYTRGGGATVHEYVKATRDGSRASIQVDDGDGGDPDGGAEEVPSSSVSYSSMGDEQKEPAVPFELLPEVRANVNLDLQKTTGNVP